MFEQIYDSYKKGELILIDGGYCRFHKRRDGQLTIHEIISQRPGAGAEMFRRLRGIPGVLSIVAKCPADLPSNAWYKRRGFTLNRIETTPSGRILNVWSYYGNDQE